ncbi:Cullin homology [Amanita muscaria]
MATDVVRAQVAAKWQYAFSRLNRGEPGISGLMTFSQAWRLATEFLRPRVMTDRSGSHIEYNADDFRKALHLINRCHKLPALLETFLDDLRKAFKLVEREVEQHMAEYERASEPAIINQFIMRVLEWYKAWAPPADLGNTCLSTYTLNFQTNLFSILPSSFPPAFKALCASTLPSPDPDAKLDDIISSESFWTAAEMLGLMDRYDSLVASVGYEHIEGHVLSTCAGQWEKPVLGDLKNWMADKMIPWMLVTYARNAQTTEEVRHLLQGVGSRFEFHMNKTLCDLRTREIFDIIIDFPDSMGALQDLKECLQRVDQRSALVQSLRKANRKRLLHPGADTKLILTQYVATIKCLRIVDPPGVLLFKIADPIRRYLRERPDTIRCIVANLVGDDNTGDSLADENEPIQPLQQPDVDDYTDPNWEPEPIDAGPEFRTNKPSDIISTLVSIYHSKDLFVKELQVLLAQRLLAVLENDIEKVDKERKNIEILKIRFGEAALQVCEVMLRDMSDSKRIDTHAQMQKLSVVHPTIISRQFWPALKTGDLVMPGQFQKLQEEYASEFHKFKPDKKLRWLPQLGTVHLELELQDRTVDVTVPPLEAAFIELFSQKTVWSMDELIEVVGSIDRSAALKALITWVDLGVLKEDVEDTFRLLEVAEDPSAESRERRMAPVTPDVAPVVCAQQQQAEKIKVYWKFVEGMLTNLGALPVDRIQSMLRIVPGYDQTVEQLTMFLEAARREGLLTVRDGMWKLNR